jgi:hypothetical protein
MLYASLVLSGIMWLIANGAVWRAKHPSLVIVPAVVAVFLLPAMATCFFPAVGLQALLLIVALITWSVLRLRRRSFLALSFGATFTAYAVVGWFAFKDYRHLVERFPYVSMEQRLPLSPAPSGSLPDAAAKRLEKVEAAVNAASLEFAWFRERRVGSLSQLHEDAVDAFIAQPGFGVARMPHLSEGELTYGLRTALAVPQPDAAPTARWSAADLLDDSSGPKDLRRELDLFGLQAQSIADFVNPEGFGFFKDRQHVAGFQEHQFSKLPEAPAFWRLRTLDLIGLVTHDEPVVYVSEHLPRMDELRQAPTRPPDGFEARGLESLRRGEDLYVRQAGQELRVLGAIRSVRQCVSCHGGARGDLLGAFSYAFKQWQGE